MPQRLAGDGELSAFPADSESVDRPLPAPVWPEADLPVAPPVAEPAPRASLEFDIQAADAARLMRLPALAASRDGRAKNPVRANRVWHDTPDGTLAARGLALSESSGLWRLEALCAAAAPGWLPATPAPILAEAASLAALTALGSGLPCGATPEKLAPVAAFEGRLREMPLRIGGTAARVGILEGALRGVLRQAPVCRLILSGEARAMAGLAGELAATLALRVPRAALGALALAVASGQAPAARRLGAPMVAPGASVDEAFSAIVAHLADVILYWGAQIGRAENPEPVHQMRVGVRRLRSALSVFRRALRDDAVWLDSLAEKLQNLAATLGVARDWDVFLAETGAAVRRAFPEDRRVAQMFATATRKREAAYAALDALLSPGGDDAWRQLCLTLALLPTSRPWQEAGGPAQAERLAAPAADYAAAALDRRLKQLLSAGESLTGLPLEQLHAIRKQAKRLRYAIEFFAPLFHAKAVRKYLARLEDMQADFGALNDAAVAACLAASLGGGADRAYAAGAVQGFGAARQARALRRIQKGWARFYCATPFWD